MSTDPITSPAMTDPRLAEGSQRIPARTLGQNDFLKLVTAQLTHQDPMNPQKDTEFIAQMAQFSSLEQAKSMQSDIAALRLDQRFLQANALLGRIVTVQDDQGHSVRGTVNAVEFDNGLPGISINGNLFDLSSIVSVEPAGTLPPQTNPTIPNPIAVYSDPTIPYPSSTTLYPQTGIPKPSTSTPLFPPNVAHTP
jgi:flagellar basal-body rod modification protein FlgD